MDFYTSIHRRLHQKKNLQTTLCGVVLASGFVSFMVIPSQVKKIDYLKLGAIAAAFISCPTGLIIIASKKDLDGKAALLVQTESDKLGEEVAADVAIEQEKIRVRLDRELEEISQRNGGNQ